MIEKVLKLGLQTFSIFIIAQTKCAQHQLSRRWNIYHQNYIFGSNFHSKPSSGMALDILAPSYVNVKVMDVWRVLRMNRWLLDGQHFITWRRETGSWGAAICYKWRWKHANNAGTMPPNGQHLYSDSTLTFFLLDRSPCITSRPGETMEWSHRRTISGKPRPEDVSRGGIIYLGLQMLTSLPTKADIPAITFIKRAPSAPQQNLLSA